MHPALTFLAIGSLGNMELLIIMILISVLLGVPLIVVIVVVFLTNKGKKTPPAPPPSSVANIPEPKANPQTTIREDGKPE